MTAVTMTMVANACGVSVSTVSHVINGTRPVAPNTRALVQDAMDRLGFVHHPASRSLAAGSSTTIGLVMPSMGDPFWPQLVQGLHAEAQRHDLQLLMVETGEDPWEQQRVVANLLAHHVSGLIIAPTAGWEQATLKLLTERPTPYVLLDRFSDVAVDQVGVENEAGAYALVSHLLSLGHTRVGMIAGLGGLSTSSERVTGYERALQRHGLALDPALVVSGLSTEEGGYRAMRQMLALPTPPTAVFGGNVAMTLGAFGAICDAGLRVPADVAVVTFDDLPWCDNFEPRLTAVAHPAYAIGARAIQLLARRMRDPEAPTQVLRLGGEIVHRTSCGCAADQEGTFPG